MVFDSSSSTLESILATVTFQAIQMTRLPLVRRETLLYPQGSQASIATLPHSVSSPFVANACEALLMSSN